MNCGSCDDAFHFVLLIAGKRGSGFGEEAADCAVVEMDIFVARNMEMVTHLQSRRLSKELYFMSHKPIRGNLTAHLFLVKARIISSNAAGQPVQHLRVKHFLALSVWSKRHYLGVALGSETDRTYTNDD